MTPKEELWWAGTFHAEKFCKANQLPVPHIIREDRSRWPFKHCGYYRMTPDGCGKVVGCLEKMAHIGTAARAWSYPGYITDRTPYGVIAHEVGHHIDWLKGDKKGAYWSDFGAGIRKHSRERPITSYTPNDAEWFAEMMRLFITNPTLLRDFRPKTYTLLLAQLVPVESRHWTEVLKNAPARTLEQAHKKVAATTT